jgi:hypothetical protein
MNTALRFYASLGFVCQGSCNPADYYLNVISTTPYEAVGKQGGKKSMAQVRMDTLVRGLMTASRGHRIGWLIVSFLSPGARLNHMDRSL